MKIKGTKTQVRAVRKHTDNASGKPDTRHPYACEATTDTLGEDGEIIATSEPCEAYEVTIHDDDLDLVQCTACGAIRHAGGATLRVYRDHESAVAGVWECEVSEDVAEKVKAAKAKKDKDRDAKEKDLAAVDLEGEDVKPSYKVKAK